MCGIVGYAGRNVLDTPTLLSMCDSLTHRGPDDSGVWNSPDRNVGLAHRRLSIIDLSPAGHQPMAGATGRVHIAFNGEIYNFLELKEELAAAGHEFRSSSDTEVVLAAYRQWGESFVERLGGMFAIALYDEDRQMLFLARDRAGEKPLFVWETADRLVFASELKAILLLPDAPRRLDPHALEQYLAWGYVPVDACILAGVRKLAPGTMLRYDVARGQSSIRRYWELPVYDGRAKQADIEELSDELGVLLEGSVRRQMIADVPIGVLLSGGVDSSLVTAIAAKISSKPVKTFTVAFPGHEAFDEAPFARLVASHFGTDHVELPAPRVEPDILPMLMRQYDEPIADSSMIPTYLVSRLIRQHATVALGGDGGDELFGGYPSYVWAMRIARAQSFVPSLVRSGLAAVARRLPVTLRGRNVAIAFGGKGYDSLQHLGVYFSRPWRERLLPGLSNGFSPERKRLALTEGAQTLLQAAQRIDFRSYMVDDILVKVDRASMLNSLEVRAPFLDPAVIEFAFGRVPDDLKASTSERKILLRRLAGRVLPPALDLKRKQGFSIPIGDWLAGEWKDVVRDTLRESMFDRSAIEELFAAQASSGVHAHRLFSLMAFELWRKQYGVSL